MLIVEKGLCKVILRRVLHGNQRHLVECSVQSGIKYVRLCIRMIVFSTSDLLVMTLLIEQLNFEAVVSVLRLSRCGW